MSDHLQRFKSGDKARVVNQSDEWHGQVVVIEDVFPDYYPYDYYTHLETNTAECSWFDDFELGLVEESIL